MLLFTASVWYLWICMTCKGLFLIRTLNLTWIFDLELSWVQYRKYVFVLKRVPAKFHWFHLNVEFFPPSCWFQFAKEEFGAVWEQLVCDPTIGCLLLIGGCYGAGRSHWVLRWCWGTSAGQWTDLSIILVTNSCLSWHRQKWDGYGCVLKASSCCQAAGCLIEA